MEVGEPRLHAVEDVAPDLRGALAVEVDQVAPGVGGVGLQVGPELREVVARRTEMVVHDVLHHAQAGCVGGVDEALVRLRAAVLLIDDEPEHAVVAPVVGAVERVHRQQLHQVDAELDEVVEVRRRGIEGALRRERAEVQLVDHRARELAPGPPVVTPLEGRGVERARALVYAGGLASRPRVRPRRRVVVDQVAVVDLALGHRTDRNPPVVRTLGHLDDLVAHGQSHPLRDRRPHVEPPAHQASLTSSATGRSPRTSPRTTLVEERAKSPVVEERAPASVSKPRPLSTFVQRPSGKEIVVSAQPFAARPKGNRVTTVTAPPRSNASTCSAAGPSARVAYSP